MRRVQEQKQVRKNSRRSATGQRTTTVQHPTAQRRSTDSSDELLKRIDRALSR